MTARPAPQSPVAISDFRLGRPGTSILATFSVHAGRLHLHGVRLCQSTSGGRFIGWPRVLQDPATGAWKPLVAMPADVTAQVRDLASAAWKAATAARTVRPDDGMAL